MQDLRDESVTNRLQWCSAQCLECRTCTEMRSGCRRARPTQQYEKLGDHHRRRSPDFDIADAECRRRDRVTVACADGHRKRRRLQQFVDGDINDPCHFAVSRAQRWPRWGSRHNRMETESAYGNVDRRQRAVHVNLVCRQRNFFMCLSESGALEGFAGLDDPAGQRNLSAVSLQCVGALRQNDVRAIANWKNEQQPCGMTHTRRVEP